MMASLAEGLNILRNASAEVWRRGSVIESWLLDLTAAALVHSPDLSEFAGHVSDSGEGRWTSIAAIDEGVPAPMLTGALYSRFSSRNLDDKALFAMRQRFLDHHEKEPKMASPPGPGVPSDIDNVVLHTHGGAADEGTPTHDRSMAASANGADFVTDDRTRRLGRS